MCAYAVHRYKNRIFQILKINALTYVCMYMYSILFHFSQEFRAILNNRLYTHSNLTRPEKIAMQFFLLFRKSKRKCSCNSIQVTYLLFTRVKLKSNKPLYQCSAVTVVHSKLLINYKHVYNHYANRCLHSAYLIK